MKLLLLILLLTSCTNLTPRVPMQPITETYQVNVVGLEFCDKAWGMAISYLYSEGIHVKQDSRSRKTFACLPSGTTLLTKLAKFVLCPIPENQGYAQGNTAWAKITGYENQDAKVIAHELMHLLKNEPHHWRGLMFPVSDFLVFYSSM